MNVSPLMLPVLLNKLRKRVDSANLPLLGEYNLSKLHLLYLMALFENEAGLTLKELSDSLDFDKANTSRAIAQLTDKGYVQKKTQGALELKYKVELTPTGREVATRIWRQNMAANGEIIALFTPEELRTLADMAGKLWAFLAGAETEAGR